MLNTKTILKRFLIVLLLYLIIFLAIIFLSSIGYTCPFKKFFGIKCIGCGMTHAFFSLINFRFAEAYAYNPLIYPLALVVFITSVYYIFFYRKIK